MEMDDRLELWADFIARDYRLHSIGEANLVDLGIAASFFAVPRRHAQHTDLRLCPQPVGCHGRKCPGRNDQKAHLIWHLAHFNVISKYNGAALTH